jgi:predicted DNA-binding protein
MTQWLEGETQASERMKCLTIDMPASLDRRLKQVCIAGDRTMAVAVLALVEHDIAELETA